MVLTQPRARAAVIAVRRSVAAVVVLAAVLLGSLAAGSPVAGEQNVATSTAGIHLGTPAAATTARAAVAAVEPALSQQLLRLLVLALASLSVIIAVVPVSGGQAAGRWLATARRGPPATS